MSKGLENIPQVPGNPFEVRQNYDIRKAVSNGFPGIWGIFSSPLDTKLSPDGLVLK